MKLNNLKFALLFTVLLFSTLTVKATHYMGGEITWDCLSNGKYVFYLKTYRECAGIVFGSQQSISSNSTVGNISLNLVTGYPKDISPICNADTNFTRLTCNGSTIANTGAVSVYLYKSGEIMISGYPPASGWVFHWGSCCRNSSTNIIGQPAWQIQAVMYPMGTKNTYPCYDSSPDFAAPPATVVSNGFNSLSGFTCIDADNDNLIYSWGQPQGTNGLPIITYTPGYSFTRPFPDTSQNSSNIAAVIDSTTGIITFTSLTTGTFVTMVNVASYREGIKISETNREVQVIIKADTNYAPNYSLIAAPSPQIIRDTLFVGDSVSYNISINDLQALPNGSYQTVFLDAYSSQFGSYIPSTSSAQATLNPNAGCKHPPCATLTPAWDSLPLSGGVALNTNFKWKATIAHLDSSVSQGYQAKTYNFYFRNYDDYCPVPAERSLAISIYVTSGNIFQKPNIHCIETKQNGDVVLKFDPVDNIYNSFEDYYIYSATSLSGNYNLVDSISNNNIGEYTHIGAGADTLQRYYIVGVNSYSSITNIHHIEYSDTISTMNIFAYKTNKCTIYLSWNPPYPTTSTSPQKWYKIYRKVPQSTWSMIDSVNTSFFLDTVLLSSNSLMYKVSLENTNLTDSTGTIFTCNSWSNTINVTHPNYTNQSPSIRTVDVLLNGDVKLTWNSFSDLTNGFHYYQLYSATSKNGPYISVTKLYNSGVKFYTHSGAGANTKNRYYFIEVKSHDCQGNQTIIPAIDTVSTILLRNYATSLNKVKLEWEPIRKNSLTTALSHYYIYENIMPGNWIFIDSTSNLHYTVTLSGNSTIYRISFRDKDASQQIVISEGFSSQSDIVYLDAHQNRDIEFNVQQNIPNPFNKTTIINFDSPTNKNYTFTVYDSYGKKVFSSIIIAKKGKNQFKLSREGLSSGIYFYGLSNGKNTVIKRFIIN